MKLKCDEPLSNFAFKFNLRRYNEDTQQYSSEGCATLPNPYPPGGEVTWLPGVTTGVVKLVAGEEPFLWAFSHPTLLSKCSQNWTLAADNVTRLRVYIGDGGGNCTLEDPMNPTRCYWRRSTQAFEGCGCEVGPSVQCLCNHATDFSASSSKPKLKPISVAELTSVTLDDLLNAWMVFAVVGGMFGGTFFLAAIFEKRDGRARRAVLRKFVDPDTAPEKFGFAVVADVWTWNIDVQEMQFMYSNLHLPNTQVGPGG